MGMIFDLAKNGFQLELMVLCSTFIELPRGGGARVSKLPFEEGCWTLMDLNSDHLFPNMGLLAPARQDWAAKICQGVSFYV